jgi:hypothetical protein
MGVTLPETSYILENNGFLNNINVKIICKTVHLYMLI